MLVKLPKAESGNLINCRLKAQNGIVGSINQTAWLKALHAKLNGELSPNSDLEHLMQIRSI